MPQIMRERNEYKKARCKKIVHNMDIVNSVKERFTISQLRLLFKCIDRVTPYRMWAIYEAFEDGLTVSQVELFANPDLEDSQAYTIKQVILDGLNDTYAKMIAKPKISYSRIESFSKQLLLFQRMCDNNTNISDPVVILIDPDHDNGIYDHILLMMFMKTNDDGTKEILIFDKYSKDMFVPLDEYKNDLIEDQASDKRYVDVVLHKIDSIESVYYNKVI